VYPYETAAAPRIRLSKLLDYFAMAEQGQDAFSQQRGFVRMAYRSKLDDTLQPYVVYLPEDFDPARNYPLLVYLHGSASTERTIIGWWGIPDGFIALGPNGRGPSNWYSWDNAQTDIAEAIRAVEANFPIDEDRILLAGFSMGGYGVYRTYYETPNTYCGIAVFSGTPRIRFGAPEGLDLIDFNDKRYLAPFKGVPVFVFHGRRDLNVPFAETEQFISKLERAGALVEFHTEADTGHENPNEETMAAFKRWIEKVIAE
jgi:dipeptidyl aminopeptidase/acylaminoacyl peptidase